MFFVIKMPIFWKLVLYHEINELKTKTKKKYDNPDIIRISGEYLVLKMMDFIDNGRKYAPWLLLDQR